MELVKVLLPTGHSVINAEWTSSQKAKEFGYASWKKLLIGETPWKWSRHCAKEDCFKPPYCGSHVYIKGKFIRSKLHIFCYLVKKY